MSSFSSSVIAKSLTCRSVRGETAMFNTTKRSTAWLFIRASVPETVPSVNGVNPAFAASEETATRRQLIQKRVRVEIDEHMQKFL